LRGMSDRDVAIKPTGMYLRRPRKRNPDGRAVEGDIHELVVTELGVAALFPAVNVQKMSGRGGLARVKSRFIFPT